MRSILAQDKPFFSNYLLIPFGAVRGRKEDSRVLISKPFTWILDPLNP